MRMPGAATPQGDIILAELAQLLPFMERAENDPATRQTRAAPASRWQIDGDENAAEQPTRELFRVDTAHKIVINRHLPSDLRRRLCWTAMVTQRILISFSEPALERVVVRLNRLATLWDRYRDNAQSQLPWELWLNSRLSLRRGALEPPRQQIILLHPAIAVEVSGGKYPAWTRVDVVPLEILGLLFYNGERTSYWGLSGMAIAARDSRIGLGVLAHLGQAAKVGYVWRSRVNPDDRGNGALFTVDLFKFLVGAPALVRDRKFGALKKQAACVRIPTDCTETSVPK